MTLRWCTLCVGGPLVSVLQGFGKIRDRDSSYLLLLAYSVLTRILGSR